MVSCLIEGATWQIRSTHLAHSTDETKHWQNNGTEPKGHRTSSPLDTPTKFGR